MIGRESDLDWRLLVRPIARMHNVEFKLEALTNQLEDLTLILKKTGANASKLRGSGQLQAQSGGRVCSYCQRLVTEPVNTPRLCILTGDAHIVARSDTVQTRACQVDDQAERVCLCFKIAAILGERQNVKLRNLNVVLLKWTVLQGKSALSGMTFGQLWKGDTAAARKELKHIFGKSKLEVGVI